MASRRRLRAVLLRLLLPLAEPSVLPPLAVSHSGCCCSPDAACGPPGVAVTSQQPGAAGPTPGDRGTVGTWLRPQQDGRQQ